MPGVLEKLSKEFKNVTQLEHKIFILENEKACLKSLLDDEDVEIGNLQERLEADTNEVKLSESYLMDKAKMFLSFGSNICLLGKRIKPIFKKRLDA